MPAVAAAKARDVRRSMRRLHTDTRAQRQQQLLLRCPVKLHDDEQMLEWADLLRGGGGREDNVGGERRWKMTEAGEGIGGGRCSCRKTREAVKEEKAMQEDRGCGSGERDGGRVKEGKD